MRTTDHDYHLSTGGGDAPEQEHDEDWIRNMDSQEKHLEAYMTPLNIAEEMELDRVIADYRLAWSRHMADKRRAA